MDEEAINSIHGQIAAMAITITSVLQSMQCHQADECRKNLSKSLSDSQKYDYEEETPDATIRARDAIVSAYLDLLAVISQHGG